MRLPRLCFSFYHSFALTSISFKDRSFLYDINGASSNISLSNGWFVIKSHFLIRICYKLGTDGWNYVTKGKMRLFSYVSVGGLVSCYQSLLLKVFSVSTFLDNPYLGAFLWRFLFSLQKVLSKSLFSKVLSLSFYKTSFYTRWATWGVMGMLESFSRFKVRAQIKCWIFFKSFAFVYGSIQERRFCSWTWLFPLYWPSILKKCHLWIFSKRAVLCRFG